MTTAKEVIDGAFNVLALTQDGEELENDEAQKQLIQLNSMLHAWELEGIKLNHSDLELNETLPFPDNHIRPIIDNFAVEISPNYGKQLNPVVALRAEYGHSMLVSFYANSDPNENTDFYYY